MNNYKNIIIVAGHGLSSTGHKDNGADFGDTNERKIVVSVAKELTKKLKTYSQMSVYTIGVDSNESLEYKIQEIGNFCKRKNLTYKDTLLISLHCNGFGDSKAHGIETYTIADWKKGLGFGNKILNNLSETTGIKIRRAKYDDESQHDRLAIVRIPGNLGILIELGFGTNPSDKNILVNNQDEVVRGLYNGIAEICNFKETVDVAPKIEILVNVTRTITDTGVIKYESNNNTENERLKDNLEELKKRDSRLSDRLHEIEKLSSNVGDL